MESSKIAKRISKKLTIFYSCIYLVLFLLLISFLIPYLYQNAVRQKISMQDIIAEEYASFQTQLSEGLNSFPNDFFNLVASYEAAPTEANRALIMQALSSYAASHSNYATIGLQLSNGEYISSYYNTNISQKDLLNDNLHYQNLLSTYSNSYFSPVYENMLIKNITPGIHYQDLIYYSKNYSHGSRIYTLTLFYDISSTIKKNDALNASFFDSYMITDKYGDLIYTTSPGMSDSLFELLNETALCQSLSGHFSFQNGLCFYKQITATGWVVVSYISYFHLMEGLLWSVGLVGLLYLISPVLYATFLVPSIRKQLAPLKTLSDAMLSFHAGREVISEIHTNDEIEDLNRSFQSMVREINLQILNIQKQEHENSVVSYKLLATQIDPHFIYNTMNIINIMARQKNTEAIVEINTALVRILRERLNSKLSISDTIRNEYQTMMQYKVIMDYRYQHQIDIHYDIDEALMDIQIPKNILQPLVENSFYHGFGNVDPETQGNIDILIYTIDQELIIEVSDNGQGMEQERIHEILNQSYSIYQDQKPHIGINNILQRLSFIYEKQYKMEIHSTPSLGTNIIITIPLVFPEEFLSKQKFE